VDQLGLFRRILSLHHILTVVLVAGPVLSSLLGTCSEVRAYGEVALFVAGLLAKELLTFLQHIDIRFFLDVVAQLAHLGGSDLLC
jgi:hypothetical protein